MISALVAGLVLLLLLLRWGTRVALHTQRQQAEQESKVLALLANRGSFTGQPMENLVQALGRNYRYSGLDFGRFMLEWKVGKLRIIGWGKEDICESIDVEGH
ncbi:hypothetical protein [Dyella choica]|uniref:Uncharacterized protein n=1 Tax=Dyella choica TaxID=1927959 RepID=A0A3S0R4R9_9GAMM|nr:hypothetical protein [Dyella choica]RUL77536.1 hypothetical protein EKH80_06550 [Dyella choica]